MAVTSFFYFLIYLACMGTKLYVAMAMHSKSVTTPHICLSMRCFTVILTQQLSWEAAEDYCENTLPGGHLASIQNSFEQAAISDAWLPFLTTNPWIGAIRIGTQPFIWSDGSNMVFSNWAPGEPRQRCGQICTSSDKGCQMGKWTTSESRECTEHAQFLCEYPMTTLTDCYDWLLFGATQDGIYTITPPGQTAFNVYCDMTTDGGGWTVIQRRLDGSLTFWNQTWQAYKQGFNNGLDSSLWLGNDYIHVLTTKDSNVVLRVDLWGDRNPTAQIPNGYWIGTYNFSIADEATHYRMTVMGIAGNANIPGLDLTYSNQYDFRTIDQPGAGATTSACSQYEQTGWWLETGQCWTRSSLNGKYVPSYWAGDYGLTWEVASQQRINPQRTEMKIRRG